MWKDYGDQGAEICSSHLLLMVSYYGGQFENLLNFLPTRLLG
jgi:hypothetical protein